MRRSMRGVLPIAGVLASLFLCGAPAAAESIFDDAVAYWAFEETGSTILDTSLTTPTINLTMNSGEPDRVPGVVGNALQIANSSLYATSAGDYDALDLNRDDPFTAACWVNPNNKTPIFSKMSGSSGNYRGWWFLVEYQSAGIGARLEFLLRSTNSPAEYIWMVAQKDGADVIIPYHEWSHVAVTFDYDALDPARGVRFYIDGEVVSSRTSNANSQGLEEEPAPPTNSTASFNINARDNTTGSTFYGGLYDEMAVWKRVLSPSEIYQLAHPIPEPGALGLLVGLLVALGLSRARR